MKKLSCSSGPPSTPDKLAKNGVIISDPTEIISEFSSHFFPAAGLDQPVHRETISFVNSSLESVSDITVITSSELDSAIGQLKNTSTPSPAGRIN
jgi:hypothetical protein